MIGEGGFDTYSFESISGQDVITDSDFTGKIKIGGAAIEGNAIPLTDAQGNVIEDRWTRGKYSFARVGEDLVIVNVGANPEIESTPKITIKDFPFSNQLGAFGIKFGKTQEIAGYDFKTIPANSDLSFGRFGTLYNVDSFDTLVIPTDDRRGRFLSPVFPRARQLQWGEVTAFGIGVFDDGGNLISHSSVADFFDQNEVTVSNGQIVGDNGNVRYVAIGKLAMAPLYDGTHVAAFTSYDHRFSISGGSQNYAGGESYLYTFRVSNDGKILSEPALVVSNSDSTYSVDLAPSGFSASEGGYNIEYIQSGLTQSHFVSGVELSDQPYQQTAVLRSGAKVRGADFGIFTPIFREATDEEIALNNLISDLEVAQTKTDRAQQYCTFEQDAVAMLKVLPAANSAICVSGCGGTTRVDLSACEVDADWIESSAYQVSTKEYSLEDLMSGADQHRKLQATDDDAQIDESASGFDSDEAEKFTVLPLPNGQRIIFTDVEARNLTTTPEDYFIGARGLNDTYHFNFTTDGVPSFSPTGMPLPPSPFPSLAPSKFQNGSAPTLPPGDDSKTDYLKEYGPYAAGGVGGVLTLVGAVKFVNWLRRKSQVQPESAERRSASGVELEMGRGVSNEGEERGGR